MFILNFMKNYFEIFEGLKIYSAVLGGSNRRRIVFKDSLNFISGALSTFYTTFDLHLDNNGKIQQKPHFPHYFNRKQNLNLRLDSLPSIQHYGPLEMRKGDAEEFVRWYLANQHQKFCLREALLEYCINDTRILR